MDSLLLPDWCFLHQARDNLLMGRPGFLWRWAFSQLWSQLLPWLLFSFEKEERKLDLGKGVSPCAG